MASFSCVIFELFCLCQKSLLASSKSSCFSSCFKVDIKLDPFSTDKFSWSIVFFIKTSWIEVSCLSFDWRMGLTDFLVKVRFNSVEGF